MVNMKYSTVRFSELQKGKRLDAEYYAPEFLEAEKTLNKYSNIRPLKDLVKPIKTGYPFDSFTFSEKGEVPLIRIRDIKPRGIDTSEPLHISKKLAQAHREVIPSAGDIVIGMDGDEFRSVLITRDLGTLAINQRIAIVTTDEISPEYLFAFLNSKYGFLQLSRKKTTATTVGHISPRDIRNLLVPIVPDETHEKITDMIKKSLKLRKDADELWQNAIKELEQFIESKV